VHVGRLRELTDWSYRDGTLELGAATTYASLEDAEPLEGSHDLLRRVAGDLADRMVRNLGTVGGAVVAADPTFDAPAVLLALDARLVLRTGDGEREVGVADFLRGEGRTDRRPDELLEAIRLPPGDGRTWAFEKYRRRLFDPAVASVAVVAGGDGGPLEDPRVVLGAIAETPLRLADVEELLASGPLDATGVEEAAQLAAEHVAAVRRSALHSHAYLRELVASLTRRALTEFGGHPC
jgi:CO/xanthine dehydrogenase FAD-binding subunit